MSSLDQSTIISRVQQRRGRLIDLPQPLSPGEFGWAYDVGRLFIGSSEDFTPKAVQVYPGNFALAQSYIDSRILRFTFTTEAMYATIIGQLVIGGYIQSADAVYYGTTSFIALATGANVFAISSIITSNGGNAPTVDLTYVVDPIAGSFGTASFEEAAAMAQVLNLVARKDFPSNTTAIATIMLNSEVQMVNNSLATSLVVDTVILTPTPTFQTVFSLDYDLVTQNSIEIKYSISGRSGANKIVANGQLRVIADTFDSTFAITDERNTASGSNLSSDLTFGVSILSDRIRVTYRNTYAYNITLKYNTKTWNAF